LGGNREQEQNEIPQPTLQFEICCGVVRPQIFQVDSDDNKRKVLLLVILLVLLLAAAIHALSLSCSVLSLISSSLTKVPTSMKDDPL
jgi:hypothetical protein